VTTPAHLAKRDALVAEGEAIASRINAGVEQIILALADLDCIGDELAEHFGEADARRRLIHRIISPRGITVAEEKLRLERWTRRSTVQLSVHNMRRS